MFYVCKLTAIDEVYNTHAYQQYKEINQLQQFSFYYCFNDEIKKKGGECC
jgi:hypothetical protein